MSDEDALSVIIKSFMIIFLFPSSRPRLAEHVKADACSVSYTQEAPRWGKIHKLCRVSAAWRFTSVVNFSLANIKWNEMSHKSSVTSWVVIAAGYLTYEAVQCSFHMNATFH